MNRRPRIGIINFAYWMAKMIAHIQERLRNGRHLD